ncbi:MAG: EamA family transporter [Gemmatimonadota bacterium]
MNSSESPPRAKLIAAFAAIYIIWGSTYLAIKFAIQTMPPFAMAATRFLIAGGLLYAWARWRSDVRVKPVHWLHAIGLGALLLCGGNGAVVWAQQRIPSGIAALVVAVVPLWVVLLDWLRPNGERPHGLVMLGIVVGLAGMAMLIGPSALGAGDIDALGALVLVGGSLSWSTATVFGRNAAVPGYPPLTSAMQLLGGGLCLAVVALIAGEPARVGADSFSWQAVVALLYLIVFGSIIAFSAYSWLLRVAAPARIATYAYVNPVVAILLGWLIADEQLSGRTLIAAAVILCGVALITTGSNRKRLILATGAGVGESS